MNQNLFGKSVRNKKTGWALTATMLIVMVLLAACQPAQTPVPPAATQPAQPTAPTAPAATSADQPQAETVVKVAADPKLGKILVDGQGMTLYIFTKDQPDQSNCTGNCLAAWPPFISQGTPKAGDGVDASLLGTASLADGSKIVTYNKMPLYHWKADVKAGMATGQGVNNVWFVVSPDGKAVGMDNSVPATGGTAISGGAAQNVVTVNLADNPKLGKILVAENGMTLYMFKKDGPDKSNCVDKCLQSWPPLVAEGSVKAGDGVDASLLGTAELAGGKKIVTYNKMPLYFFAKDSQPGDVTGQDVNQVWYAVSPDGKPVEDQVSPSSTETSNSPASEDVKIKVAADPTLGKILVDGSGMTLYIFKKDEPNKSNCTGNCLQSWPPLVTVGGAAAEDGVNPALLGTATLADGRKIVTYNQMPLYHWKGDVQAGDATGQGVNNVWYVISPDGKPVVAGSSSGY